MNTEEPRRALPLFQGLLPLRREQLVPDILAGVTLAALALPEVLGYTKIAGTPVITGIYTMLLPMLLYGIFGASRHLVVGADSATAAILAACLAGLSFTRGSAEWLAMAQVMALLAGAVLLLARLLRLGFLADFLSRTVLTGFLTGVGIQVAVSQLPDMLGLPAEHGSAAVRLLHVIAHAGQANLPSLAVAAATLGVILGAHELSKKVPGALIAVAGAIFAASFFHLDRLGVALLGPVPNGLPTFGLPHVAWSWKLIEQLLPTAAAIFVVILAQSAATSRAFAALENERFDENTDITGLALANLGAAFTGTFVVNGSPTKTQMVESAGGRSQLAQFAASLIALFVLLFLTRPLELLPEAALAAIIFRIGMDLVDIHGMRRIFSARTSEFWIAVVTALTVVFVGVEQSILLAVVLSLLDHTRQGYRPHNCLVVRDDGHGLRAEPIGPRPHAGGRLKMQPSSLQVEPGLMIYRFTHSIYYANTDLLLSQVTELVRRASPPLRWFCIDASAVDDVDFTGAATVRALQDTLRKAGVNLVFAHVSDDVRDTFERYELSGLIDKDALFDSLRTVIHAYAHAQENAPKPA
ncbi:MAG TPA: SulP family inorganic anion transporter [Bryobacteraceae bacterium]|nr:SulP family inorganic anion transporter [Bryobacteraceae bacterium]